MMSLWLLLLRLSIDDKSSRAKIGKVTFFRGRFRSLASFKAGMSINTGAVFEPDEFLLPPDTRDEFSGGGGGGVDTRKRAARVGAKLVARHD